MLTQSFLFSRFKCLVLILLGAVGPRRLHGHLSQFLCSALHAMQHQFSLVVGEVKAEILVFLGIFGLDQIRLEGCQDGSLYVT